MVEEFFVEFVTINGSLVDTCALNISIIETINELVINIVVNDISDKFELRSMRTAAYLCDVQNNVVQLSYEGFFNSTYEERRLQGVEFVNEFTDALIQNTVELTEQIAPLDESLADVVSIYVFESPSSTPSTSPTFYPTTTPSTSPTLLPSKQPSTSPSTVPSVALSITPSDLPTTTPSAFKSDTPSSSPTSSPSFVPSMAPSVQSSLVPSIEPSLASSMYPSSNPTHGGKSKKEKKQKKKKKEKKKKKKAKARRRIY